MISTKELIERFSTNLEPPRCRKCESDLVWMECDSCKGTGEAEINSEWLGFGELGDCQICVGLGGAFFCPNGHEVTSVL